MLDKNRKVLLIGWDAADWKVINPLIEQGKMPATAKLIEGGVMGNLTTLHPVLSPMLWTSIGTGKRPFKHGVLGFSEPTPDGGGVQPISHGARKSKAIWNMLNQHGLRSNVVGWWPSHPVEQINGAMVSNHYQSATATLDKPWPMAPGTVHPPRLEEQMKELRLHPGELIAEQILPFVPKAIELEAGHKKLRGVIKTLAECASVHAAATWLMQNEPWDFMAVYYDAIDHFCHGYMRYHPPRRPHIDERDYELFSGVVEAAYRFHDAMLGSMLSLAPEDVTVIICSDHGFHPDHLRPVQIPNEPAGPAAEHRDLGVVMLSGPGLQKDALIHGANLLDITPTILTLYGLPVGADMDGKPLLEAFENPPEVETIPSWEQYNEGDDARLEQVQQFDALAAKAAMEQLVALGYVAKLDEDKDKAIERTARELRYNLALSYMDAGLFAKATPILEELYDGASQVFRYAVHLGMCYRTLGRVADLRKLVQRFEVDRAEAARQARREIKQINEEMTQQQREAGELDKDGKLNHEALPEKVQKHVRNLQYMARFNSFDIDYMMAWVLAAEGDEAAAVERLRKVEGQVQDRPGLHVQIGTAYVNLRQWESAERAFHRALEIDPLHPQARLGLARTYLPQRRTEEAASEVLEAIRLQYHIPMAHYVLGQVLMRLGQPFRARDALNTAVTLNPNFERAHRMLARLYRTLLGNPELAARHRQLWTEIRARRRESGDGAEVDLVDFDNDLLGQERQPPKPTLDIAPERRVPSDPSEFITVVAGLPRSGTSMMMQMLAAAPLPILTDAKREADEDNPRGYFELEAATRLRGDATWLDGAEGKAVKIVAQLLPFLPTDHAYRVVFMERDLDEVLASQQVMLKNLSREAAKLSEQELKETFLKQLMQVKHWLAEQAQVETLYIGHREVLENPAAAAEQVAQFLGGKLDVAAMAGVVDRTLYRQRGSAPIAA